jgi:hypothetical protein
MRYNFDMEVSEFENFVKDFPQYGLDTDVTATFVRMPSDYAEILREIMDGAAIKIRTITHQLGSLLFHYTTTD